MTKIEWTRSDDGTAGKTWNPVTGCSKVSQGCKHCYAEGVADRFWKTQYSPNEDGSLRQFTDVRTHEDRLDAPLRWKKPKRVFVNSMSDLFHEKVPFKFIDQVWAAIGQCPQHTFQILTKRPERMLEYSRYMAGADHISSAEWPRNAWLGVSVEDQKTADERIPLLRQTPAAVRWVSYEPALGPVDFKPWLSDVMVNRTLDWIVCGGESGSGARPMDLAWARSVRDQCLASGVKFFMKQLGGASDKRGELCDLPSDLRIREYPGSPCRDNLSSKTEG